jgi:hypothetical protein
LEHGAPDDAVQAAKAEFHAHLAALRAASGSSAGATGNQELLEDAELLADDREMDSDNTGSLCNYIVSENRG